MRRPRFARLATANVAGRPSGLVAIQSFHREAFGGRAKAFHQLQVQFVVSQHDADDQTGGSSRRLSLARRGGERSRGRLGAATKLCLHQALLGARQGQHDLLEETQYPDRIDLLHPCGRARGHRQGQGHDILRRHEGLGPKLRVGGAASRIVAVVGYVNAQNVTGFSIGGLKVGDTIEIGATGVAEGEKNILFFPDPTQQ